MKVILLEDVENVGKKYEVKEVKDGHARNFLIPKNLVKLANKKNLTWLKSERGEIEKQAEEDLKKSQALASTLGDLEVTISVKVGPEGQLFESINNVKIAEKLKEMGYNVKKSQVILQNPIKELGEFPVKISLDHNLESDITVIISGEGGKENGEE